ncbi:3-oxo-tetronate kinase [Naasia lichenicola]|uniref:3-oxo-tetronate kinase n=1 Tax=Naasia lichenicola TaxID=2565933 RepID=A0A4S4FIP0_9MICO|nr:3-oxo-tetronate kinase [Naasia lichenicola]THG30119.1 four-carbon acid sugar kinase family protein [Naasia lichenicola]
MLRLAAIADDFTGATDLATSLRERGLRVAVVLGASAVPTGSQDLDAVIVALKSRTAPVAEAVGDSLDSIRALSALEPQQYFVKYCSTFDSTPQGNIGPVLDAVLEELGETRTVVVPAFPDNHRTVRDGTLYVGGDLLSESSMRHHPLTPMTESRIARILGPQTKRSIAEVGLQAVRGGVDGLRKALEAASAGGQASYLVVDALTNDDLQTIQAATADWRLLSGSAGLAFGMSGPHDPSTQEFDAPEGRRLVVCGSASSKTRVQIATALAAGAAGHKLDVERLQDEPQAVVDEVLAWLDHLDADAIPIIYSVGSLADLRDAAEGPAGLTPAEAVEAALSQIVVQAVERLAVRRVIVAGGETSGAVATALGCRQLLIGPQIAPGVCWSLSTTASDVSIALALKSGNFGADDMFIGAWEALV